MKTFRILMVSFLIIVFSVAASAAQLLIPGGQLVGLELQDNTVTVVAFEENTSAAKAAGLQEGDRILKIDGVSVGSVSDIRNALDRSDGQVDICVLRGKKTKAFSVCPDPTQEGPKLGVYLKQGTTGVGTVTYYDPEDGSFAALGHGVNTANGNLLQMTQGAVYSAKVMRVKKGAVGTPGQLVGSLTDPEATGKLSKNTNQGVFGDIAVVSTAAPLPVAQPEEIRTGSATIRSTVEGDSLKEYSVEILKIYPTGSRQTRNMLLKVTDPTLLSTTGGIVQGMSGSPIIQNGKIIGAVTHVLVNDPTMGYGIFIENMLDAAV
ncbi:MAG: PDZ domain-containing protein [Oscillospiraceae bacterium]|nr:PDZ domain-containing protein [Oscillospiraceae bacterium]